MESVVNFRGLSISSTFQKLFLILCFFTWIAFMFSVLFLFDAKRNVFFIGDYFFKPNPTEVFHHHNFTALPLLFDMTDAPEVQGDLTDVIFASDQADCNSPKNYLLAKKGCSNVVKPEDLLTFEHHEASFDNMHDFRRVVLIVSLAKPHFESISKVHRLYRGLFQKIVYCVAAIRYLNDFLGGAYLPLINTTIIEMAPEITSPTGATFYMCIPKALDLMPDLMQSLLDNKTEGFLHVSDDLIPNLWTLKTNKVLLTNNWLLGPPQALYDLDRKMYCKGRVWDNLVDCTEPEGWHVLREYNNQTKKAFDEATLLYPDFIHSLAVVSSGERRVWNIYADLFYVAREYVMEACKIFRVFGKHGVYMELALGSILKAITQPPTRLQYLSRSGQIYGEYRLRNVTETYSSSFNIYHPFKLSKVQTDTIDRQCLYCTLVDAFDRLREKQGIL